MYATVPTTAPATVKPKPVVFGVEHDVGRLQIAVHDAGLVRGNQPRDDLPGDRQDPAEGHPALAGQDRREIRAVDVRHRDVLDAVDLANVVDADHVPVGDLAGKQQLALEPPFDVLCNDGVRHGLRTDDLDRNRYVQLLIPRLVDRSHAARPEQADDAVAGAEVLADLKRARRVEVVLAGSGDRAGG